MSDNGKFFGSRYVTEKVDISLRMLYYWELKGVIKPKTITMGSREFKRYTQGQIETLKSVKKYIDEGHTLTSAVQKTREAKLELAV